MATKTKLLVVTDLDATLLDHSYSWAEAKPALDRLQSAGFPLVLNSSKTVAEMKQLAEDLGLDSPIVAENGGLLAIPADSRLLESDECLNRSDDYCIEINGLSRDVILSVAHGLRDQEGYDFAGFADWTVADVADRTGLDLSAARRSKSRFATEPIVWSDTPFKLSSFKEVLAGENIRILKGGRFLHLMGPADKADGAAAVLKLYQKAQPDVNWVVVTLGDSANDQAMLEAADIAVVIPHQDGPHLDPKAPRVVHAPFPASKGWNEAILSILDEYC
ncbi:MAG TPA: mannosyl-3-phosphoglycerate phosphatase [Opitutae bacterium]|nr:mannosyl-3-phosphoglycerate phosphatase [Opitutae bacterium]